MHEADAPIGGVASTGIATLVAGAPRSGHVLAASPAAAYLLFPVDAGSPAGGEHAPVPVVALEAHGSVGLPLGVGVPAGAGRLLDQLRPGDEVGIGHGRLRVAGRQLRVARWRDPRPALAPTEAPQLAGRAARALSLVPAPVEASERRVVDLTGDLVHHARRGDHHATTAAADAMLGLGPGSTPAGDDVLAGFLAAGLALSATVRGWPGPQPSWFQDIGTDVAAAAPRRTPALSAALLWHAARGHVAAPAAALLRALTGRGDVSMAAAALCAVGHSSGAHLARGLLAAAHLTIDHDRVRPAEGSRHARTPGGPSRRLPRLRQPDAGQPAGR